MLGDPYFYELNRRNWEEADPLRDAIPYNPDFIKLMKLGEDGVMRVWVARDRFLPHRLAGYFACVVTPSLHHQVLWAYEDSYILDPAYRRGWNGYRMIATAVEALRALGVEAIVCTGPEPIFKRLGFVRNGRLFYKAL